MAGRGLGAAGRQHQVRARLVRRRRRLRHARRRPSTSCATARHPAATRRSTCPSRRRRSRSCSSRCDRTGMADNEQVRRLAPGRGGEAVRLRPASPPSELNDLVDDVFTAAGRVPDRPLPGQGDGPEHPGAALRQRAVRAGVELQLRRLGADHHGRGRRHRHPGRLLRRDRRRPRRAAEPPAAAARAGRDGGADQLRRATRSAPRSSRCCGRSRCPTTSPRTPSAASTTRAGWPASGSRATCEEKDVPPDSTTETYVAVRLGIQNRRWAGVPFYLRTGKRLPRRVTEIAISSRRRRTCRSTRPTPRCSATTSWSSGCSRTRA